MDPVLKETRGEIVNLLKTRQGVSASELAEELELHSMTIRQHLAILESNGYIQRTKVKSNRGRPKFFYHLTQKAKEKISPSSYPQFAVELLDILESIDGSEKVDHLLRTHVENKVQAETGNFENKTLSQKVDMLTSLLNREGYMVELEETLDAYLFKMHHCILKEVAQKYRQLCNSELEMFLQLLGVFVERVCHIIAEDNYCSYRVSKLNII